MKERIKCYFPESLNFITRAFSIYYLSLLFLSVNLALSIILHIDEFQLSVTSLGKVISPFFHSLQSSINIHILHTALYIFAVVLTWRIYMKMKSCLSKRSFPLFS